MSNPRFLLSQSNVIDNVISTSTNFPLSANQGRILQNQISSITSTNFIKSVVDHNFDSTFLTLTDIGTLNYDSTNNQVTLTLTNTDVGYITIFNITKNYSGATPQTLDFRTNISVSDGNTYYFSSDGNLDTNYNLAPVSQTELKVGFVSDPFLLNYYFLDITIQVQNTSDVYVYGTFSYMSNYENYPVISYNFENLAIYQTTTSSIPAYSYGGREEPYIGITFPFKCIFLFFTYFSVQTITSGDATLRIHQNEILTGDTLTLPNGNSNGILNFPSSIVFEAGDRLWFDIAPNSDGQVPRGITGLLIGYLIE